MQNVEWLSIEGLALVRREIFADERGFFVERFRMSEFEAAGLPVSFEQDNHSRSDAGVLRGIHYQYRPQQGKLVGVTRGRILDVAVDLRPDSATFGESYSVELSDENGKLLWIPAGFGHGFLVLGDRAADVLYKTTAEYEPTTEGGIIWNDPDLAIDWGSTNPRLSTRDSALPTFAEYRANPPDWLE
jgi:dTDP-4-dehydrorhamnose 3,5-epimerase